jgi:hypothetical protein
MPPLSASGKVIETRLVEGAGMKASRSLLAVAYSLPSVLLAGVTYWLWWAPKRFIDVEPYPLTFMTIAFWATVVAILVCLIVLRRNIRVAAVPLLVATLVVAIPAATALTMTSWWLKGIPQAEIRAAGKQPH